MALEFRRGSQRVFGVNIKRLFGGLRFEAFRNDKDKCDFITCGAASGIGAAFAAPIGGTLFALEEGATHWNNNLTFRTFFSAIVTTWTLNIFLSFGVGGSGDSFAGAGLGNGDTSCNAANVSGTALEATEEGFTVGGGGNDIGFFLLGGMRGTFNFGTFTQTCYYAPEMLVFIVMAAVGGCLGRPSTSRTSA